MSTEFDRDVVIRPAVPTDAEALSRLYNHYVEKTHVTFEEDAIIPGEMARRIQGVGDADFPWIVGERSGRLVGYAYVCP